MKNPMHNLLQRTNLTAPFGELLSSVETKFPSIGKVYKSVPIEEGYEDANFILETPKGKFVLKLFLEERSRKSIDSYVKILKECKTVHVPTIEILTDFNDGLGIFEKDGVTTYYIITKFFEGENFQDNTPTLTEILLFTEYIARLNTLTFKVEETYDSWGNTNFAKEFVKRKSRLTADQKLLVEPIYKEFLKIKLDSFSKSLIHGDIQRKHFLKSKVGNYCLLDFGCMANSPKVIELSTYLAWFALQEDTWLNKDEIYKKVIDTYTKTHKLTTEEIASVPILTRSSWAAYFTVSSSVINDGDKSEETAEWHRRALAMLKLSSKGI